APQGEGLAQVARGGVGVAVRESRGAALDEVLEEEEVDGVGGGRDAVAAGVGGDGGAADGAAEAGDEGREGGGGVERGVLGVGPDLVDQGVGGGGAVG